MSYAKTDEELLLELLRSLRRQQEAQLAGTLNPLVLLERLVNLGLLALEGAVGRMVRAIIR